ncbi:MAG: glutamine-hydrolyzing carbamoyl-phosphate synthase small subunit [Acidobacteriota bacterium]|jgi:carbamoyl-phosphate synthase small subunit
MEAVLALEDGRVFRGRAFGATAERGGEVVFNTSMTGYQEILTDPSYRGQIVCLTYPEIGNYGVNELDVESGRVQAEGLIVRELSEMHSSWRSRYDLHQYLKTAGVPGISEIDTRALTRHIRREGAMRGVLSTEGTETTALMERARGLPRLGEQDLVAQVTCKAPYTWLEGREDGWAGKRRVAKGERYRVVAYDFGIKRNILRYLYDSGCSVLVVPGTTPAAEVLDLHPEGVFLSNGPGDPESATYAVEAVRSLIGRVPIFGICLGHQILTLALGGRTFKLKFGHHGANHPVQDLRTGRVEITSQNHGYSADPESLGDAVEPTHVNLNDRTNEGWAHRSLPIFAVQYHPEASPGPHDGDYLFERFAMALEDARAGTPRPAAALIR